MVMVVVVGVVVMGVVMVVVGVGLEGGWGIAWGWATCRKAPFCPCDFTQNVTMKITVNCSPTYVDPGNVGLWLWTRPLGPVSRREAGAPGAGRHPLWPSAVKRSLLHLLEGLGQTARLGGRRLGCWWTYRSGRRLVLGSWPVFFLASGGR